MVEGGTMLHSELLAFSLFSAFASCNPLLLAAGVVAGNYGIATFVDKAEEFFKSNKTKIELSMKQPFIKITNIHVNIHINTENLQQLNLNPKEVINHILLTAP